MACNIEINKVIGVGTPLTRIVVTGIAEDCPDAFEGGNLEVTLSCRSADDPDARTVQIETNPAGSWVAEFLPPLPSCACGGAVFVTARCLTGEECAAPPVETRIACDECPRAPFSAGDDVNLPSIETRCDFDGTALVTISFDFFNSTSVFLQARVNPGPGGSVVTQDAAFVGPGSSARVEVLLRYDPVATPVPAPFIEYVRLDGFTVLDCPPVELDIPALPACEPSECPMSVVLEVTDGAGQVVQVSGNNAQICLLPGQFTVSVVFPAPQPGVFDYSWSEGGVLVDPQPNGPALTVDVGDGQTREITVAVEKDGCASPTGGAVLKGCVIDCDIDLILDLRDADGAAVALNQPCIPAGTYTAKAVGPVEPPWDFAWTLNGVLQIANTTDAFEFGLGAAETADISVTATAPGCGPKTAGLGVTGCAGSSDPDSPNCGTLLLAAIGIMLAGAVAMIAGICLGSGATTAGGVFGIAVGLLLLGLWLYFCRKTTSCAALQKARCLLIYAGAIFVIVAFILSLVSGLGCGIPAALTSVGWFGLASVITDTMVIKGCTVKPCLL